MLTDKILTCLNNINSLKQKISKLSVLGNSFFEQFNYYYYKFHTKNVILYKLLLNKMKSKNIQYTNSIKPSIMRILDQDIKIVPFWNNKIKQLSDQLFMPSIDNIQNIPITNKTFKKKTWFSVKEYIPVNKVIQNDKFNYSNKKYTEKEYIKTKKIKVFFTKEQRYALNIIIGTYRYYYNRCVAYFNNYDKTTQTTFFYIDPIKQENKVTIDLKNVSNRFSYITARSFLNKSYPSWLLKGIPVHLLDQAIIECCNRMKTCMTNFRNTGINFNLSYKKKNELTQTINLEKAFLKCKNNKISLFSLFKINGKYMFRNLNLAEIFPKNYGSGSLTYHTILKEYYFNISYSAKTENLISNKLGAIDQGIRDPFTIFSQNDVVTIGSDCSEKLYKKCKELDIIVSRMNRKEYYIRKNNEKVIYKVDSKRKRNLRRAMYRKIKDIKNMRNELHNKTIKFLTDTYKGIILPPFNIQDMAKKLHNKTARSMYTLSFYAFKLKLRQKAFTRNVKIFEFCEPYTSKTCGKCGLLNRRLGCLKTFNCLCGLKIDRDINGARNILLRNLSFIK